MTYVVEMVDSLFGPFKDATQASKWAAHNFGFAKWRVAPVSEPIQSTTIKGRMPVRRKRK